MLNCYRFAHIKMFRISHKGILMKQESYFDGGLLSFIGHSIVATLITIFTLSIYAPWGIMINWKVKHTVIDGQRLYFDGKAIQLFGNWIKWLILTIITIGIYSFCLCTCCLFK